MLATSHTIKIIVNNEELDQMIREHVIKKYPHLESEEFEIKFLYDSYGYSAGVQMDIIDPGKD